MNAQRTCAALAILTLCGCASVPETETPEEKKPGWHITRTDEGKEHTVDQQDEQMQWADSEAAIEWIVYICSLPAGPEREKQLQIAHERKLGVYCPPKQEENPK